MSFVVKKASVIFVLFAIVAAIIVGARGGTNDTGAYYGILKNIELYPLSSPEQFYEKTGMEIGFGWYSYIISLFTTSSFILFSIFSFFTFLFIYHVNNRVNSSFIWVFFTYISSGYFAIQQFMQIRQGIAIPIVLLAVSCLFTSKNKKYFLFTIFSFLGMLFHQMAIPVVLMGFVLWLLLRNSYMDLFKFKILSIVLFFTFIFIAKFLLVDILVNFSGRVEDYSTSVYAEELGLFRLPNIKAFLTFLLFLILIDEELYKNKLLMAFYLMFVVGLAFRMGFTDFAILSGRFATAFTFTEIFLLPTVFLRFGTFGVIGLVLFIIIQFIATYMFQVPNLYELYKSPLYVY